MLKLTDMYKNICGLYMVASNIAGQTQTYVQERICVFAPRIFSKFTDMPLNKSRNLFTRVKVFAYFAPYLFSIQEYLLTLLRIFAQNAA